MMQRLYTAITIVFFAIPALAADKASIAIVNFEVNDIPRLEALQTTEPIRNDAASDYRGASDPTLWLGVGSLVGSAVAFAAGAGWYKSQKSDYDFSRGSFNANVLLMLGQPLGYWYVTNQHKKAMVKNVETRNNVFIGAGSAGGLALIMFITFGVRQAAWGGQAAVGEIYRKGSISVIIPPQYYSFSNLLKRKYPGLGLGINYQF